MLCACIDIGSNTTRVLVADVEGDRLREVLQKRAFTRIGKDLKADGALTPEKVAEVAEVVADYCRTAHTLGAQAIRTVATAAIRSASNRDDLVAALRESAGVETHVLDGVEEAHLAFLGATRTFTGPLDGEIGVVDVGGGSTEIAVGTVAGGVTWSASFRIGSGYLADAYLREDPPAATDLHAIRQHAAGTFEGLVLPVPGRAVAVGGSATSLRRLVGAVLEPETIQRAIRVLSDDPADVVAGRFGLDAERVRLLPAGILILDAAAHRLGCALQIGRGGLREGVCLELAAAAARHELT
jgi:exopolyphosphatase/guanosine-5'-triphosphate,3'-diphosphate pyrophosphatase